MNILTFDVEEWFHLLDNDSTRSEVEWIKYPVRIYENMDRIFRILDDTNSKATFFIIGWIAKTYPDLVKRIAERYEIGSHTMNHQLVWQQDRATFKEDVSSSIKLLEDITGKPVKYFRAPGFSIRESEPWAFEVIKECGIEIDCSVFPAHHAHGGIPSYGRAIPSIIKFEWYHVRESSLSDLVQGKERYQTLGENTAKCYKRGEFCTVRRCRVLCVVSYGQRSVYYLP